MSHYQKTKKSKDNTKIQNNYKRAVKVAGK